MITFLLYILFSTGQMHISEAGKQIPTDDYYEKGIEYLEDGNWQNALNLWIDVRDSLRAINKSDFRIGQKFIEHVTANELSQLYPLASEMYLWGLQSQDIRPIKKELEIEIEMLQPLIPESKYENWRKKIRQNDESVLSDIKGFWIEQNPVLDTSMNERLIEHWERIAYSRVHFNNNRITAYNTDDRGIIYVKMGEPDKIESGNFLLNNSRVQFFAREILRQQDEEVDGFGQDRISVDNRSFGEVVSDSYYRNNISKAITDRVLTQRISSDYEVWIYENQTVDLPENLLFIFGTDANTGNYGMIQSPVDFIPVQAFRPQRIRDANFQFNTGAILQLSLYDNLKYVDDKFLDIYNDLYDRLMSDQSIITESSTSYLTHRYADELEAMRSAAPDQISIYDKELETFPVQTQTFRFFDENLSPYHLLMAVSTPHESIIKDNAKFLSTFENIEPRYHLKHTLVVHDENWTELYSTHDFPEISFDSDDITNQLLPSSSLFRIRNADPNNRFRFYGSIINESLDEVTYGRENDKNLIPDYIIGSGMTEISKAQMEHGLDPDQFEVSDLVVGYRSDFELDDDLFIPFYIPADKRFSTQVDLHFLFEVYNISRDSDGFHRFEAEYQVLPADSRSRVSRLFTRSDSPTERITLNFESEEPISKNHISVDISDYRPGSYTLRIVVSDEITGERIEREENFTILE